MVYIITLKPIFINGAELTCMHILAFLFCRQTAGACFFAVLVEKYGELTYRNPDSEPRPQVEPIEGDQLGAVASLLQKAVDIRRSHFTRPVTTFISKDGEKLTASIDQAEITIEDSANVKVWLKSHEREIAMTIGGILLAAGMITLQKNRTQRKKMSKRAGSYIKPGQR